MCLKIQHAAIQCIKLIMILCVLQQTCQTKSAFLSQMLMLFITDYKTLAKSYDAPVGFVLPSLHILRLCIA